MTCCYQKPAIVGTGEVGEPPAINSLNSQDLLATAIVGTGEVRHLPSTKETSWNVSLAGKGFTVKAHYWEGLWIRWLNTVKTGAQV